MQRHYSANKGPSSQSYAVSSKNIWLWDYKENWVPKNWCFWMVVLEKTLESPLGSKEFQPVHPKGNQSWIFTGRTDAGAETPIFWPPDEKNWLIWNDLDDQKNWRWPSRMKWLDSIPDSMDMKVKVWKWKLLSHVQPFATPWTVACQAPLSMKFSRPEYRSG